MLTGSQKGDLNMSVACFGANLKVLDFDEQLFCNHF